MQPAQPQYAFGNHHLQVFKLKTQQIFTEHSQQPCEVRQTLLLYIWQETESKFREII